MGSERSARTSDKRERKSKRKSSSRRRDKKERKRHSHDHSRKHYHKHKRARRDHANDSGTSDSDGCSGDSSSASASDAPVVRDLIPAAAVVRSLLFEFPSIAPELLSLLQTLDDGETAILSDIANARVKALLGSLFALLGLRKLRKPADAYAARKDNTRGPRLLETVAAMLGGDQDAPAQTQETQRVDTTPDGSRTSVAQQPRRREAPIGPMMPPRVAPPTSVLESQIDSDAGGNDDDDDDVVGPALPGMKGFRVADERVEAEMTRRAKQLEENEWRRARGELPVSASSATPAGREAWMVEMPENNKVFDDAMGPMKPRTGKPAAFRSKEPAQIDSTWFDSPEERERAERAKLDMELLGYVRPENAPPRRSADHSERPPPSGKGTNESILPAANPREDEDMRRQMETLKQKRGPSLLEQHQEKIAEQKKAARNDGGEPARTTWSRERDLTARRGLSQDDADRIISASKQISSKFTAPTVTRQFL